jgi:integrase
MGRRGKGEGNIRKRKDGRWEAAITVGYTSKGNPKRVSVYGKTREEVSKKLFTLGAKHGAGLLAAPDKIMLDEYLASWVESKTESLKQTTLVGYTTAIAHICRHLGKVRLQALRPAQVQNMYSQLRKSTTDRRGKTADGLKNGLHHIHRVLRAALNDAVKMDLIALSPLQKLNAPTVQRVERQVWTPEQAGTFLETAKHNRVFALFWLALSTGMRRGELLGLHWADIDFAGAMLQIRRNFTTVGGKTIVSSTKTHRSTRAIALSPEDIAVLQDHHAAQEAEREIASVWQKPEYVFTTHIGTPINPANLSKIYKTLVRQSGVPDIRFHDLRHSNASLAALQNISPKVLSERLGHSTVTFTMATYQHTYHQQHQEAARSLSAVLSGKKK